MGTIARTLLAAILLAAGIASAQGIAFISNLKGDVAVDGNPRPLILSELAKGQRITVAKDSQVAVMYIASGKEYLLKGPDEFLVKDMEVASVSGMPPLARSTEWRASTKVLSQVAQTSSASVRMRSIRGPKVDKAPKLFFPTQGSVSTLRPSFQWNAETNGDLTLVAVGHEKPVHEAKSVGAGYRLPIKLKPDTEYAWTLVSGGYEVGSATFRTLPAATIAQLEKRRPGDKAEFSDRVLYALYLQELGAVQEAREWWAKLSNERSDLPELSALGR